MELELQNGDYVPDGIGGVRRVSGGRRWHSGSSSA